MNTYPTLVFIHGNSSEAQTFSRVIEKLKGHQFDCLAFDLPGHGNAERFSSYTMKSIIKSVVNAIEENQLEDYILVGHSFGGHVALPALEYLQPRAILTYATAPLNNPPETGSLQTNPALNCLFSKLVTKNEVSLMAEVLTSSSSSTQEDIVRSFLNTDSEFRAALVQMITTGDYKDEMSILSSAQVPVQLCMCKTDALVNGAF